MTDHAITIATRQAPIDTLEPPTMGALYRWECSCGKTQLTWRSEWSAAWSAAGSHIIHKLYPEAEGR